jgi:glycosyltransferase involved in cell wall biosynthesis
MMRDAYGDLFGKPCFTMHTGARRRDAAERGDGTKHGVAYFGNLGYSRNRQIVEIGKPVRRLGIAGIDGVEVYSAENNPEILKDLTPENGIMFMGRITADEVARRMDECVAVIFTESFNERDADAVRYSVSTKIADLLMNGPCIIAYGPEGIASVDYLKKNEAAYVITDPRDLDKGLLKVLTDDDLRRKIVKKARALAAANHDDRINSEKLAGWLEKASKGEIRSAEVR